MSKILKYLLLYIGMIFVCLVGGIIFSGIWGIITEGQLVINPSDPMFFPVTALLYICFVIWTLLKFSDGKSLFKDAKKTNKTKQFFDSEWLTEDELNRKYEYSLYNWLYIF